MSKRLTSTVSAVTYTMTRTETSGGGIDYQISAHVHGVDHGTEDETWTLAPEEVALAKRAPGRVKAYVIRRHAEAFVALAERVARLTEVGKRWRSVDE